MENKWSPGERRFGACRLANGANGGLTERNPALKRIVGTGSHVPLVNAFAVDAVKDVLKYKGIDADIGLGVCDSVLFSSPNKYVNYETNQEISHQDVLNILKGV